MRLSGERYKTTAVQRYQQRKLRAALIRGAENQKMAANTVAVLAFLLIVRAFCSPVSYQHLQPSLQQVQQWERDHQTGNFIPHFKAEDPSTSDTMNPNFLDELDQLSNERQKRSYAWPRGRFKQTHQPKHDGDLEHFHASLQDPDTFSWGGNTQQTQQEHFGDRMPENTDTFHFHHLQKFGVPPEAIQKVQQKASAFQQPAQSEQKHHQTFGFGQHFHMQQSHQNMFQSRQAANIQQSLHSKFKLYQPVDQSTHDFQQPVRIQQSTSEFQQPVHIQHSTFAFQQPVHIQHSTSEFQQPMHIQHSTSEFQQPMHIQHSTSEFQQPVHIQHSTSEFQQPVHIQHSMFHNSTDDSLGHKSFTLIIQAQRHKWQLQHLPTQQFGEDNGQQTQSNLHVEQNTEQAGLNQPNVDGFRQIAQAHLSDNEDINKTVQNPEPDDNPEQNNQSAGNLKQQAQSNLIACQNIEQTEQNQHSVEVVRQQTQTHQPGNQDIDQNIEIAHEVTKSENETAALDITEETDQNQVHDESQTLYEVADDQVIQNQEANNKFGQNTQSQSSDDQDIEKAGQIQDANYQLGQQTQSQLAHDQEIEQFGQIQDAINVFGQHTQSQISDDQDMEKVVQIQDVNNLLGQQTQGQLADDQEIEQFGQIQDAINVFGQHTQSQISDDQDMEKVVQIQDANNLLGQHTQGQLSDDQDTEQAGQIQDANYQLGQQTQGQLADDQEIEQFGQIQDAINVFGQHTQSQLSDDQDIQIGQIQGSDNSGQEMSEKSPKLQHHPPAGSHNSEEQQSAFEILNQHSIFEHSHSTNFGVINDTHILKPHWWNTMGNIITSAYEETKGKVTSTYDEAKGKVHQIVEKVKEKYG